MSRPPPTLCLLCEAIGPWGSIAGIARGQAEMALAAGWRVTVVAHRLCDTLQGRVEWLPLYVPPRSFALQWLTGRHWIKRALGPRRFDVVHGHQPQIADLCDVYQCHFLTRAAYEAGCLYDRHGPARVVEVAQKRLVLAAEDRFYRRWNPRVRMLYDSDLTRRTFERLYGVPPLRQTLIYASPPEHFVSPAERAAARARWLGPSFADSDSPPLVAGFLGGVVERKGYRRLLRALAGERGVFLLFAGPGSAGFEAPTLTGHFRAVGECADPASFYAACDVLVLPSRFEPFGLVASEAIARGVPVVATDEVGALPHVLEHGAGVRWQPATEPLAPLLRAVVADAPRYRAGCARYNRTYSAASHDQTLLGIYHQVLAAKSEEVSAALSNRLQRR